MAKKKEPLTPKQELAQLDNDLQVLESDKARGDNAEPIDEIIKAINKRIKQLKAKGV